MCFSSLSHVNFVRNRQNKSDDSGEVGKNGWNIQLNDREYYLGANRYVCANIHSTKCKAYIIVSGLVTKGTATGIEKTQHCENCPTLSQQHDEWIAKST